MVCTMRSKVLALLLLCFFTNFTVADWGMRQHRRDSPTTLSTTTTDSTTTGSTTTGSTTTGSTTTDSSIATSNTATATDSTSSGNGGNNAKTTAMNSTSSAALSTSPTLAATISAITSNINGPAPTSPINPSGYNSTLTPNDLPIQPTITPGFAVAGVILMLTGAAYTLVGIKNKFLHIFLSAAYLASIAVTVLILYVMNPPVSNAIQGAYLVAITITGLVLGVAAVIFTEITEGLGSLLGGFCLSMWLLVLKPGGLLTTTSSKAIFIACFTIASFCTSFSHYTRPYGLIAGISFSGATAIVLGLDCFSRAGLKEFWAYLWALNTYLFPLGATSYPLTRGIRVEIAAIVIIFLAGIVSQMKLWKVIKERREQRVVERLQDERDMQQEEENVGRRIEHANAAERDQWEAVYGDKDAVKSENRDSGVGDMDSQKKGPMSTVTTVRRSGSDDDIEMSEIHSPTLTTGAGLVMANHGQEGAITVRVARDLEPPSEIDQDGNVIISPPNRESMISPQTSIPQRTDEGKIWVIGTDGEAHMERRPSRRDSRRRSGPTASPDVVPLPFKVPEDEEGVMEDDRSSVATFADEEQAGNKRRSSAKRLSAASALIRRLSRHSPRSSKHFSVGEGISTEDLVIPRGIDADDDRASSVAATIDGLSDDEDMRSVRSSVYQAPDISEITNAPTPVEMSPVASPLRARFSMTLVSPEAAHLKRPTSDATIATTILDPATSKEEPKEPAEIQVDEITPRSLTAATDPEADSESLAGAPVPVAKSRQGKSVGSAHDSRPSSISKATLPPQLSRVVMSYRTNEWAKHLSNAETPDLEELELAEYPAEARAPVANQAHLEPVVEMPAPVNVEELQQTAENAVPPPAPRSVSQSTPPLTRSSSALSGRPQTTTKPDATNEVAVLLRSLSQQSLSQSRPPLTMVPKAFRSTSQPLIPQPIAESPIEEDFASHSSTNLSVSKNITLNVPFGSTTNLISKRDSMMRNKSSYYTPQHQPLASTPEIPHYASGSVSRAASEAGSAYNYPNTSAITYDDDEDMSLSARRDLIRQNSLSPHSTPHQNTPLPFDSHQPRRQSSAPNLMAREQQMANWRASVQQELRSGGVVEQKVSIERQRSALWQERQQEELRRQLEERRRSQREGVFDERMRRGDMLGAHRDALRKMQAAANKQA